MFPCGSFAVPQILGANPEMNIGLFAMPACDNPDDRIIVSGVDLCWNMTTANEDHREEIYEVIDFLNEPENLQTYCDDQKAIPCIEGDFTLDPLFDDIQDFLDEGKVIDYPDHSYPSGMACDAQLQAFLMDGDVDAFLANWDNLWQRYNKTVIRKYAEYMENQG